LKQALTPVEWAEMKSIKPWPGGTSPLIALILGVCLGTQPLRLARAQSGEGRGIRRHQASNGQDQVKKLTKQLNLNADQQVKVNTILQAQQNQLRRVQSDPSFSAIDRFNAMRAIHENSDKQIRSILNDDQANKFDRLRPQSLRPRETQGQSNPDSR
jgi:hypothetical protein